MNLDAIFRAANENTDPDPSERDFEELMANALRVCLDDLLANRGPLTDEQRKEMFARLGGGGSSPRALKWYDKNVLKAGATKMPQVNPEMLERLRKRIAGEK